MTEIERLKAAYYEARAERDAAYAALAARGALDAARDAYNAAADYNAYNAAADYNAARDAYNAALAAQEKEQDR